MASGESRWITGLAAREDVHRLRAAAGAVLTTSATVLTDDPELTVRLPSPTWGDWRQPDRIIIDSRNRVPSDAKVWHDGARRFALLAMGIAQPRHDGVEVIGIETGLNGAISLPAAFAELAAREINEVLVECGPPLAGGLLMAGLVDEVVIYTAPKLLGHAARPLVSLPGLDHLADHIPLEFISAERIGDDLKIIARIKGRE
jgi:diaminohydroxyphosphoribosylaminopyrimidine deaminase/5-amino-6-(5-phosphoribosylamino)uracil reductase